MQKTANKEYGIPADNLKRDIERIKGVFSASVVRDHEGDIAEIHMEASPSRHPKQIVRDTESLLHTRFGIALDYRKISLVQLEAPADVRGRLRLVSASLLPGDKGGVRVVLGNGGDVYKGTARVLADGTSHDEPLAAAAAEATLDAMQQIVREIVPLHLDGVFVVAVNEDRVCLTVVSAHSSQGQERLTGTAIIKDNMLEAASRATLDAVNRRLVIWTQES